MEQRIVRRRIPGSRVLVALVLIALAALLILAVGSYMFNWTWTGFRGNTLWDWLKLLLLPLVLTAVSIWFSMHRWGPQWTALLIVCLVALAVLAVGGYAFNWTWTGFKGNTLWNWLELLLLPLALSGATLWFSAQGRPPDQPAGKETSQRAVERSNRDHADT